MKGRKRKTTARHELENTRNRLAKNEPQHPAPEANAFDLPPEELSDSPRAAAEWRRLAPMLRTARQVTDADRGALIALCLEWARYVDATKKVATLGLVVKAPSGYPMANPYLSIATRALAGCNKLWPELGLTPVIRARVVAGPAPPLPAETIVARLQRQAVELRRWPIGVHP